MKRYMSFITLLYTVIIGPLELLFEQVFALACHFTSDPGLSIVFLSLAVNFLVLPLYRRADAVQDEARETEKKLAPWVSHIKKTFTGDERFMMLQAYYRENHYRPSDALKGSVSLMLEIPFFMAAYNFLSGLAMLEGASFGPIRDLASPDGLLVLGGMSVNVLPIAMTVINIISGIIYTKGSSLREKIQLFVMAGLFLVLLYDSPAGLVFYWTLNNLFSLVKNILCRTLDLHKMAKAFRWTAEGAISLGGAAGSAAVLLSGTIPSATMRVMIVIFMLAMQLPLVWHLTEKKRPVPGKIKITRRDYALFFSGGLFLTILIGGLIPTAVVGASPAEFVDFQTHESPLAYIGHCFAIAFGTFLLWLGIFYMLASPQGKKTMGKIMWFLSIGTLFNYLFFGSEYGNLSAALRYDVAPSFSMRAIMINAGVLMILCALGYLIWKKRKIMVKSLYLVTVIAMAVMSVLNVNQIHTVAKATTQELTKSEEKIPEFTLSKKGKNVVVLMMDRGISSYIPYMFREKPELKAQFAGFTYYPNTISYGGSTNFGSPALYGGYDYTPEQMNLRKDEPLVSKHNEALRVMPVLFDRAGYEVTVCDPSAAGYSWIPDLSIYDDYPRIHTYLTYSKFHLDEKGQPQKADLSRNLFCYSLFRAAPVACRYPIYAGGTYNDLDASGLQSCKGLSRAIGRSPVFEDAYAVLKNLPAITRISQGEENTFLMLANETAHSPALLQEPEYIPAENIDNRVYDEGHRDRFSLEGKVLKMEEPEQVKHYQVNMAAMLQLGSWMDWLREQGVYENTRIIIVADHGHFLHQRQDMLFEDVDLMRFNPLLMVKDFGDSALRFDDRFMTNGDVPTLALEGIVENPVNPFTGNPINSLPKAGEQKIILSGEWDTSINNGNTFMESRWVSVKDNLFDLSNWKQLGTISQ